MEKDVFKIVNYTAVPHLGCNLNISNVGPKQEACLFVVIHIFLPFQGSLKR